ncbi:MAG: hypothetical protein WBQ26_05360 [Gemmatimonadaceae bacterium]
MSIYTYLARSRWVSGVAVAMVVAGAATAGGQKPDTARAPIVIPRTVLDTNHSTDTTRGPQPELPPPLSPGRSFAYSFLFPGYAQTVLGRPKAAALFLAFEALAVTMLHQAQFDLRQARNAGADSTVETWWDPATGQTGPVFARSPYDSTLVRSRRAHVEDWVAAIIANHLFAGIDAYVAANLWDVPAELTVQAVPGGGANLGVRVRVP